MSFNIDSFILRTFNSIYMFIHSYNSCRDLLRELYYLLSSDSSDFPSDFPTDKIELMIDLLESFGVSPNKCFSPSVLSSFDALFSSDSSSSFDASFSS